MRGTWRTISCLVLAAAGSAARGQSASSSRPMLEQLERETKALYAETQGSVVRVVLPPPMWAKEMAGKGSPLEKWGSQLDEGVRKKLEEHVKHVQEGEYRSMNAVVTAPGTQPATGVSTGGARTGAEPTAGGSVTVLAPVRVGQGVQYRPVTITFTNHIGIVLDEEGHVLVPLYVERQAVGDRKLPVTLATGQTVGARFVGSDAGMNVTVLQTEKPIGKPARMASGRPGEGELVMMVSPNAPGARLEVWTGGHQEMGLVVGMDGRFRGFSRFGHFLQVGDIGPEVRQLIETGVVKRAQLGVWVQEVAKEDSIRQRVSALGDQPAVQVVQVFADTAAQRAGLLPNDLILTLAGKPVGDTTEFAMAISRCSGGTELRIIRGGEERTVRVELTRQ